METLRLVLAWCITGAWIVSIVLSFIDHTYTPRADLTVLMAGLAAFLFGPKIAGRNGKNGSDE